MLAWQKHSMVTVKRLVKGRNWSGSAKPGKMKQEALVAVPDVPTGGAGRAGAHPLPGGGWPEGWLSLVGSWVTSQQRVWSCETQPCVEAEFHPRCARMACTEERLRGCGGCEAGPGQEATQSLSSQQKR